MVRLWRTADGRRNPHRIGALSRCSRLHSASRCVNYGTSSDSVRGCHHIAHKSTDGNPRQPHFHQQPFSDLPRPERRPRHQRQTWTRALKAPRRPCRPRQQHNSRRQPPIARSDLAPRTAPASFKAGFRTAPVHRARSFPTPRPLRSADLDTAHRYAVSRRK
jgi:hypothetical protein